MKGKPSKVRAGVFDKKIKGPLFIQLAYVNWSNKMIGVLPQIELLKPKILLISTLLVIGQKDDYTAIVPADLFHY